MFLLQGHRNVQIPRYICCKLLKVERNILYIEDVDIVDGTPLLDIKPYVPEFDVQKVEKIGWLSRKIKKARRVKSDKRFK